MKKIIVSGMQGLGDNIYQYPIIQFLCHSHEVFLFTPWPEIYADIPNLHFLCPESNKLRTQGKNIARNVYTPTPPDVPQIRLNYRRYFNSALPYYEALLLSVKIRMEYFLRMRTKSLVRGNYAVIRPATLRQEWYAGGRNPHPEYLQDCIVQLNAQGLATVVVADIDPPAEVYAGERPDHATVYYERGELQVAELLDLVHRATVVVGGVGFIVPMCLALGTPGIIIHGGVGGSNAPERITAPGEGELFHLLPNPYCRCHNQHHRCNKILDKDVLKDSLKHYAHDTRELDLEQRYRIPALGAQASAL